ncbi:MAG: hypothetical protein M1823_001077 [Watsoniomyces obsoletus]|nr:MAG: hypothetical protein M1823_001077 [Watsoniomyces obsoletus]
MSVVVSPSDPSQSESFTLFMHGSCPRCHHWLDRFPIRIVMGDGTESHAQSVVCANCHQRVLAVGGNSPHESLASLLTEPRPSIAEVNNPTNPEYAPAPQVLNGFGFAVASIAGLGIIQGRYPPGNPHQPVGMATRASFEQGRAFSSLSLNWRRSLKGKAVQRAAEDDAAAMEMGTFSGAIVKLAKTVKDRIHAYEDRQGMVTGGSVSAIFSSSPYMSRGHYEEQQQQGYYSSSSGDEPNVSTEEMVGRAALHERRQQATLRKQQEKLDERVCYCGQDCACFRSSSCSCSHQAVVDDSESRRSSIQGVNVPAWNFGYTPGVTDYDPYHHQRGESSSGAPRRMNMGAKRIRNVREDIKELEQMGSWMTEE